MCKWHGGTYAAQEPVKLAHPRWSDGVQIAHVDPCIAALVQALNDAGLQTLNSCCGHFQRPGWIALEDGRHLLIVPSLDAVKQIEAAVAPGPVTLTPKETYASRAMEWAARNERGDDE